MIVWLLTGLWHGGTMNYVIWGVVLGLLIIAEKYLLKIPKGKGSGSVREKVSLVIGRINVIVLIPLTWVIFAIVRLPELGTYYARLFPFFGIGTAADPGDYIRYGRIYWPFFIAGTVLCIPAVFRKVVEWRKKPWMIGLLVVLFWVSMYYSIHSAGNRFMYFSY